MNKTFGLLFYLKKSKIDTQGRAPIYLRITIDGKRSEISTKRYIETDKWCSISNRVKGRTEVVKELNTYLDILTSKVYRNHKELMESDIAITALVLKNKILGIQERERTLLKIYQTHNDQMLKLIGKEYALGTLSRYKTVFKHLQNFIKLQYKIEDLSITKIDYKFIADFDFYLRSEINCGHNCVVKYIKTFKKIYKIAQSNNWVNTDPFINYKVQLKEVIRQFLSKEEIDTMYKKELHTQRLDLVRDMFVFSCFTGLAYSDVKKLTPSNLVMGIDGEMWIKTNRTKTNTTSNIPLLPIPLEIINKYKNNPLAVSKSVLLPVLSNQKMNAYLKEIADLCGIIKPLTTHLARHTFATTVTLTNGVPLESVSKMLGHKSIKTTQHYAKILDLKVSDDMQMLRHKFANSNDEKKAVG